MDKELFMAQIESLRAQGYAVEEHAPWMVDDKERKARWAHYFSEQHDLKHDPVLNHYEVPEFNREVLRRQTEIVLDNTLAEKMRQLRGNSFFENTTTTSNIETFTTWALPMIRKIWPRLFASQLVSVQPMKGPTGKAFTLDFVYGTAGGAYASGTSIYSSPDPDYADDPGEAAEPKEINLTITGTTLTAEAKKLKAVWTQEAAQDLGSQYGLNLENEVVRILGMEIEREIDRQIINEVISAATTNTTWTSTQPATPSPWANATPKQYAESIFDSICDANKQIYDRIYRDGNLIVCGSTFANRLTKLNGFRSINTSNIGDASLVTGPNLFGVLKEQYRVFKDPYMSKDQAIVAHKSNDWMYTGFVFAPYIPVWTTPLIWTTTMTAAKGMMSRYETYAKNGDFFATVSVS